MEKRINRYYFVKENSSLDNNVVFDEDFCFDLYQKGILDTDEKNRTKWNFVGLLFDKQFRNLFICFPKYINLQNSSFDKLSSFTSEYRECHNHVSLTCDVIKKLNIFDYDFNPMSSQSFDSAISRVSLAEYLLKDYMEHGVFQSNIYEYKRTTYGKIDWKRTINGIVPYLNDRMRPIYDSTINRINRSNDNHILTQIHKYVLCQVFDYYRDLHICSIKDYIDLYNDLNDESSMLLYIKKYLTLVNSNRDIGLLKALLTWLSYNSKYYSRFELVGTVAFHCIWEKVCQNVIGHDTDISKKMPIPEWRINSRVVNSRDSKPLLPDILRKERFNEKVILIILDAKYYHPRKFNEGEYNGLPATTDVSKQIVYQRQLKVVEEFDECYNGFIVPTLDYCLSHDTIKIFDVIGDVILSDEAYPIHIHEANPNLLYKQFLSETPVITNLDIYNYFINCGMP